MPELPDITVYCERLTAFVVGRSLAGVQLHNPFTLRTVSPPLTDLVGHTITDVRALGKRLVFAFDHGALLVMHLMIAGRLRWRPPGKSLPGKLALATFAFEHGSLFLTEAGTTRRAALHVLADASTLPTFDRGGIDPLTASVTAWTETLQRENHTIKRSLTDPRLFSGIGNAYSDEILHRARLSPLTWSTRLTPAEIERLREATMATLQEWTTRLRGEVGDGFPETVTAFHEGMAVHGRFGQPCPVCGAPVQRIRYADNETNYCARCQTDGRILADRALSRLLKQDFPRSLEELEG